MFQGTGDGQKLEEDKELRPTSQQGLLEAGPVWVPLGVEDKDGWGLSQGSVEAHPLCRVCTCAACVCMGVWCVCACVSSPPPPRGHGLQSQRSEATCGALPGDHGSREDQEQGQGPPPSSWEGLWINE